MYAIAVSFSVLYLIRVRIVYIHTPTQCPPNRGLNLPDFSITNNKHIHCRYSSGRHYLLASFETSSLVALIDVIDAPTLSVLACVSTVKMRSDTCSLSIAASIVA